MTVFKYIEDKDVFQKFYSKMLSNRLIKETSASEDAESSMIGKLKDACGFEYTTKLHRMFQDIQTSRDTNSQFKDKMQQTHDASELKSASPCPPSLLPPSSAVCRPRGALLTRAVVHPARSRLPGPGAQHGVVAHHGPLDQAHPPARAPQDQGPVRAVLHQQAQRPQAHLDLAAQPQRVRPSLSLRRRRRRRASES